MFPKNKPTLLETVQHPNVVELLGSAFKDDERNPEDIGPLIDQQMESHNKATINSPPFPLPIAIDIVLQVVEAMIQVKACRVLLRDLKPKNCLTPKFKNESFRSAGRDFVYHMYYAINQIDFRVVKMQEEDFYSHL